MSDPVTEFRKQVESALVEFEMAPSAFGQIAVKDRGFVFDLLNGKREPRSATRAKVEKFIVAERERRAKRRAKVAA